MAHLEYFFTRSPHFTLHGLALTLTLASFHTLGCERTPLPSVEEPAASTAAVVAPAVAPLQEALELPTSPGALAPHLAVAGDRVALSWLEALDPETSKGGYRLRISFYAGSAWSAPVTVFEGEKIVGSWADTPSVILHPNGSMLAYWPSKAGEAHHAYNVMLASSPDGKTWKALGSPHRDGTETEHGFVSGVVEGEGFRLFWLDGRETAAKPRGATALRTAVIKGGAIEPSAVVDPRVCDCCGTGAALSDKGPVVVYRDRSEGEVRDVSIVRASGASTWSAPASVHEDRWQLRGCPVNGPVVVSRGGDVNTVWFTSAGGRDRVQAAFSTDGGLTFGPPVDVDSELGDDAPLGRVSALALEGGDVLVTWLDGKDKAAVIRGARVSPSGRVGAAVDIASTTRARTSGFPRTALVGESVFAVWTVDEKPTRLSGASIPLSRFALPSGEPRQVKDQAKALLWPRPKLKAKNLEGKDVALDSFENEVVLVNIFATWCKPCREELPLLTALHDKHTPRGLRVVGISVDSAEAAPDLKALVASEKLPYAIWHDSGNTSSRLFGVSALPASFLFDRSGKLVWSTDGALEANDPKLAAALEAALASP